MEKRLLEILSYYLEGELSLCTNIKDYNINELDITDIMMDIEDEFEVSIDYDEFNNLNTIKEIYEYLQKLLA